MMIIIIIITKMIRVTFKVTVIIMVKAIVI